MRQEGYFIRVTAEGPEDEYLHYEEGCEELTFYIGVYQGVDINPILVVPVDDEWIVSMPAWACERKSIIVTRIKDYLGERAKVQDVGNSYWAKSSNWKYTRKDD